MNSSTVVQKNTNLIALVESGDKKIFELFFNEISGDLKMYLNKITGNSDIARDIFQETFLKASDWVSSRKYKAGNFKAWICTIAHNLWIDHLRSTKIRNIVSINDLPYDLEEKQSESTADMRYDWNKILLNLTVIARETFILRYIRGLTYEEIAERLNININTCKARAWKGKRVVRKLVTKTYNT